MTRAPQDGHGEQDAKTVLAQQVPEAVPSEQNPRAVPSEQDPRAVPSEQDPKAAGGARRGENAAERGTAEPVCAGLSVTEVREAFLPQLLALERACFSDAWTEAMLRSQLSPGHVFLAALAGQTVVGYAAFAHVLDEGDITNVAVAPAFRRRGAATALLDALEARAAALSLSFLTLEVRESNAPARALYRARGFREVGRRKRYYEKPREDAILMTKQLISPREADEKRKKKGDKRT